MKDTENKELIENNYKEKELQFYQLFPENTQVIYLAMIDDKSIFEEDLLSFGLTNNLKRRVSEHKKNYKNYKNFKLLSK